MPDTNSVADIFAATGARLMDAHLGKLRQQRLELVPDPFRNVLAGRVVQPIDFIQIIMVKLVIERLENGLEFGEIANPASVWIDLATDVDGGLEGVTMQATTLMPCWDMGKAVCCFKSELFENFHGVACIADGVRAGAGHSRLVYCSMY